MIYSQKAQSNRRRVGKATPLALLLSTLVVSQPALAQDDDVIRPLDLFDAGQTEGVDVAPGLVLRPRIDALVQHDSNVYNDEIAKLDDIVGVLTPELAFQTELSRHYSELRLRAVLRRYADISGEDSEQFELSGRNSLDLGSRFGLATQGGVARRIELRGTAGDQFFTDEPIHYRAAWAGVELSRTQGLVEVFVGADIEDLDYSNSVSGGVPVDLTFRDVQIAKGHARIQYLLGPATSVFVEGEINQVRYDLNTAVSRNSSGYSMLAGVTYQVSALIEAEAAIGSVYQDFKDPAAKSVRGIDYNVALSWTPTPRWELTASGERSVNSSPLGNVPALVVSQLNLGAQTVVSDRILVNAQVGYVQEAYRTIDRKDDRYFVDVGTLVRVTDNLLGRVQLGYRKQSSDAFNENYDGFSAGVGLTLQM